MNQKHKELVRVERPLLVQELGLDPDLDPDPDLELM
jgi:hypothetical protein